MKVNDDVYGYEETAKGIEEYIKYLKDLSKKDPKKAKRICKLNLIRTGVIKKENVKITVKVKNEKLKNEDVFSIPPDWDYEAEDRAKSEKESGFI